MNNFAITKLRSSLLLSNTCWGAEIPSNTAWLINHTSAAIWRLSYNWLIEYSVDYKWVDSSLNNWLIISETSIHQLSILAHPVTYQVKISTLAGSCFSYVRICFFSAFYHSKLNTFRSFKCCLDKTRSLKASPWALWICSWHLSLMINLLLNN